MRKIKYQQNLNLILFLLLFLPLIGKYDIYPIVSLEITSANLDSIQETTKFSAQHEYLSSVQSDLLAIQSPLSIRASDINESFEARLNLINPLDNATLKGQNITIAVLDSGINDTSWIGPDVIINRSNVIQPNASVYDNIGHGSLVGSIISKIAPEARLLSIKVTDETGSATRENIEAGIRLALTYNVSIIHASLGSADINAINSSLISTIANKNISLIVSAGNSGPFGSSITSPAVFNEAIAVGMVYNQTYIPYGSSVGPRPTGTLGPDIVAPGVYIPSFINGDEAQNVSGTSFASPFVTGTVALLRQAFPNSSSALIKTTLIASAKFIEKISPTQQGNGLLDMLKAYKMLKELNNSLLLTFTPRKISSNFTYFGQTINGQTQTYNLGLYSTSSCTLESMNVNNILPIQATIPDNINSNLSLSIKTGFNMLRLSLLIPDALHMDKWGGNITFHFSKDNSSFDYEFPIQIENRYPGGRILFYQGYDNNSFIPDGPTGTFSLLHYYLEKYFGMQVTGAIRSNFGLAITGPLRETISPEGHISATDLENYDILVLADIEMGLTIEDINVIHNWVDEGHSLLILSYPSLIYGQTEYLSNRSAINTLLEPYGLSIDDDSSKPKMTRFSQASLAPSSPIAFMDDYSDDPFFDYNGTSIKATGVYSGILATASNVLDASETFPIAGFWHNPDKNGKVVVFGSLEPFTNMNIFSSRVFQNFDIASQTFRWLIKDQEIPMEVLLGANPSVGTSTRIQITFLNDKPTGSFNGTIIENNGSYTQITFKPSYNTFVGTWKPKKLGTATLWLNLQIEGSVPSNGLFLLRVYDPAAQDLFLFFFLGSFVVFAVAYYWISSRRTKPRLTLQEQLSMQYKKPNAQTGTKSTESQEICSRCRSSRHNVESKYCFNCGKEL